MSRSPAVILYDALGNAIGVNAAQQLEVAAGVQFQGTGLEKVQPTSVQSGSYPDPSVYDTGEVASHLIDSYGNLQTRGPVFTDEASFRDDFNGGSLLLPLAGTVSFANGSTTVAGIGTAFLTEIQIGDYVRLGSHPDSALALVSYVVDDLTLELEVGYSGASASGSAVVSHWKIAVTAPAALAIGSSELTLTQGTAANYAYIERQGDYLPFVLTFAGHITQRIANQETAVGFVDDPEGIAARALIVFSGIDATKIICRSANSTESLQETAVTLPGTLTTAQHLTYQIEITPNQCAFLINGNRVAAHQDHIPDPYAVLRMFVAMKNTATVGSATALTIDYVFFQNTDQVQTGHIFRGEPQTVQGVAGGVPVTVQFGSPGGLTTLPTMINLFYSKSDGAIIANAFKRVLTYVVPTGFSCYLIKFVSFQGEAATSRLVTETTLATHNCSTNSFSPGSAYQTPQWAASVQASVTTQFASGAGSVTFTVSYTNQDGIAGRTGTIAMTKGALIGSRFDMSLQSGDLGVRSIQSVSSTPLQVGVVAILGLLQLALHQDQSTTTQTETLYAPGAVTFPTGTVLGIEYAGLTVSKQRLFDTLIQLVVA